MATESSHENEAITNARLMAGPQEVLFAQGTGDGRIIGVVTDAPPSSLMLLAAGVAGMAARRARRARANPPKSVFD
jgi:hypothetical protein